MSCSEDMLNFKRAKSRGIDEIKHSYTKILATTIKVQPTSRKQFYSFKTHLNRITNNPVAFALT